MLKVLEELERAVGRMMEKAGKIDEDSSAGGDAPAPADTITGSLESVTRLPDNEEAAELIRRALKRLRSL